MGSSPSLNGNQMYDFSQFLFFGLFHYLWTSKEGVSLDDTLGIFPFGNQSTYIYLAPICARNFIMCWEYIKEQIDLMFVFTWTWRKSQQIDVESL